MSGRAPEISRRGLMVVLSSPSGAGKTTISRRLLQRDSGLTLSISLTTRRMRPGETAGVDYIFVDAAEFARRVALGELLEHASVFGNDYGTPRAPVEQTLSRGSDVLFDIDWQGTQQIAQALPEDLVSIFVLPPTVADLERRLRARAQDSDEEVARRMAKASDEMSHWAEYDYVVVNRDLDRAFGDVRAILAAERLKRERLPGLSAFVRGLRAEL